MLRVQHRPGGLLVVVLWGVASGQVKRQVRVWWRPAQRRRHAAGARQRWWRHPALLQLLQGPAASSGQPAGTQVLLQQMEADRAVACAVTGAGSEEVAAA